MRKFIFNLINTLNNKYLKYLTKKYFYATILCYS